MMKPTLMRKGCLLLGMVLLTKGWRIVDVCATGLDTAAPHCLLDPRCLRLERREAVRPGSPRRLCVPVDDEAGEVLQGHALGTGIESFQDAQSHRNVLVGLRHGF